MKLNRHTKDAILASLIGVAIGYVTNPFIQSIRQKWEFENDIHKENSWLIERVMKTAAGEDGVLTPEESLKMAKELKQEDMPRALCPAEQAMLIPSSGSKYPRLRIGEDPQKGKYSLELEVTRRDMFAYLEHNNKKAIDDFKARF